MSTSIRSSVWSARHQSQGAVERSLSLQEGKTFLILFSCPTIRDRRFGCLPRLIEVKCQDAGIIRLKLLVCPAPLVPCSIAAIGWFYFVIHRGADQVVDKGVSLCGDSCSQRLLTNSSLKPARSSGEISEVFAHSRKGMFSPSTAAACSAARAGGDRLFRRCSAVRPR